MMLSLITLLSIIYHCSSAGEYASHPQYRFPIQRRPEAQYEAVNSPYESSEDAAKYAPFSQYGALPKSAAPHYAQPPQYREPPQQYGQYAGPPQQNPPSQYPDDYQYEAPPQGTPPSQYESAATTDDYYAGVRPDQVPLNPSAGVHDGGADIPGIGFVKGYPFSQMFSEQEGYDIPGRGFIAGYPFAQIDFQKDSYDIPGLGVVPGYPFSYIGAYTPKSDPREDGYENPEEYRQAAPDDSYSPKAMYPPAAYRPASPSYHPQAIASPSHDYAQPKTVKLQYQPAAQTEYLAQPLYGSSPYPNDASSDPYAAKDSEEAQDAEDPFQPSAYPRPTQMIRLKPQYPQPGHDEYAQAAQVGYAQHPALNHIPSNVHLPKFMMNPPNGYRGLTGPQYH